MKIPSDEDTRKVVVQNVVRSYNVITGMDLRARSISRTEFVGALLKTC